MSSIALATASADLQKRVLKATDGACLLLPLETLPSSPAAFFAALDVDVPPDVIVLDSGLDPGPALSLATLFDEQCPKISVLLVSDLGLEIGLEAMRAGIRDIMHPDMVLADLRPLLDRACASAQARAVEPVVADGATAASAAPAGRVISVVSPKGGVGKTTVATNLAVGLAHTAPHSTVLVDLDAQFGDVGSALNLDPEHSLADALRGPASRDTMVLKTFLTLHETGVYVICAPKSLAAADSVTAEEVSHLLQMLASEFEYVVVDTATGLLEPVLAAMDESDALILVTSMDVPGVRGLRKELDALTDLDLVPDSRCIVLNFADAHSGLSIADVEATLGTAVDVMLPRSKATPASVNRGVPLLQSGVRDPMTLQLQQLVERFTAETGLASQSGRAARDQRPVADEPEPQARPRRTLSPFRRGKGAVA